ncbi:hypothetical protein [Herbaspirillum sp. VT-16-41]|uniref:hypothetical protein n=1 Tax=Herbaspirillum sp. VT-16-41 TaxID=1953765 RepID=UPI000981DAAA|nr:hypothetical protein [Herbaspirillum sp. VT-16-41]ONN64796.1 hypothetical protein BTM36_22095 [Herbaspirillum sp. VT-16-41]
MPGQRVSRSELYDLVWSEPTSKLAKRFGISDVMLSKVSREANIPKPGLGYWAKLESGRMVERTPLPTRALGQDEYILFGMLTHWETSILAGDSELVRPHFPEGFDEVSARARALAEKAPVRKTLSNPHPTIAKILRKDEALREKRSGRLLSEFLYRGISDSKQGRRRLTIVNALLKALDHCGAGGARTRGDATEWSIHIGNQVLAFKLAADSDPRLVFTRGEEEAPLTLAISWWEPPEYLKLEWSDEEEGPLEDQIRSIVEGFLVAAEFRYREIEMFQYDRVLREKTESETAARQRYEEAIQQEESRLSNLHKERRQGLFEDAAKWKKAEELRAYIKAALAVPCSNEEEHDNIARWASWALAEADQIDPLKKGNSEDER